MIRGVFPTPQSMTDRPEHARDWLSLVLDPGWEPLFEDVTGRDPLRFPGYREQLEAARKQTGATESVSVGSGTIEGNPAVVVAFEFGFLGGSMGTAAGERIRQAFGRAARMRRPKPVLVAITRSGGARMQEGMLALAQMASTVRGRQTSGVFGSPFIAYLANPTTGGVYASFASLADLVWAEPGATIGFAGPRVAERMTGVPLPPGSHTAEHAYERCLADAIVPAPELRDRLAACLATLSARPAGERAGRPAEPPRPARDAWEQVGLARHADRPSGRWYAERLLDHCEEMRRGAPDYDATVFTAIGRFEGHRVVVVAQDRHAGDGRTRPAGFRRAQEAVALAERLDAPLVSFVDTPGADPSGESESDGIAREIALTFDAMLGTIAPTVSCVVGEGGSGGALSLAVADRVLIQENAVFSVIAPESAAAILGRDDVERVAAELRPAAHDLRESGLAHHVVAEPPGGAHADPEGAAAAVREALLWALDDLRADRRWGRIRRTRSRSQWSALAGGLGR